MMYVFLCIQNTVLRKRGREGGKEGRKGVKKWSVKEEDISY